MKIKMNESRKHNFRFEVANLITEARYHYKITQKQLAKKVGTQQPSIARIESGSTLPSLSFLERLADSLGTYLIAPQFGFMKEESSISKKIPKQMINVGSGSLHYTDDVISPFIDSITTKTVSFKF